MRRLACCWKLRWENDENLMSFQNFRKFFEVCIFTMYYVCMVVIDFLGLNLVLFYEILDFGIDRFLRVKSSTPLWNSRFWFSFGIKKFDVGSIKIRLQLFYTRNIIPIHYIRNLLIVFSVLTFFFERNAQKQKSTTETQNSLLIFLLISLFVSNFLLDRFDNFLLDK